MIVANIESKPKPEAQQLLSEHSPSQQVPPQQISPDPQQTSSQQLPSQQTPPQQLCPCPQQIPSQQILSLSQQSLPQQV